MNKRNIFKEGRYVVKCPKCGNKDCTVIETKMRNKDTVRVRRRRCEKCGEIFRTLEVLEKSDRSVLTNRAGEIVKKFDRDRLKASIVNAAYDSSISLKDINQFINSIEFSRKQKYSVDEIFEATCEFLKKKDYKTYVRYAVSKKKFIEEPATSTEDTITTPIEADLKTTEE